MAAVSAAAATGDDKLALLAHSWTQASRIYEEQLVPRFNPWTQDALAQLSHHALALPSGVCVVPCCGPGHELPLVAAALGPERTLIGSDLSPGMVEIASARAASVGPQCTAVVADAMQPLCEAKLAAILTVFGLQQLPDPVEAVKMWCTKLEPAGVAVICFWPSGPVETLGPWQTYSELMLKRTGSSERKQTTGSWDEQLAAAAEAAGADVVVDTQPQHTMEWPDGEAIWEYMTRGGPWHYTRLRRGDAFMDDVKSEFLQIHPMGQVVRHAPRARLLVLRKREAATVL
jgi:SAM-dependent methyltransferase